MGAVLNCALQPSRSRVPVLQHGRRERPLKRSAQRAAYFEQFGKVSRVRVSRSKRTARSKGYAYVQFALPEVAAIAAEAMDGYMMFSQKLNVHLVAPAKQHPELFKGAGRQMRRKPWAKIEAERFNAERTPGQHAARVSKLIARDTRRRERIKDAGIEYEYEPLQAPAQPIKTVFT